MRERQPRHQRPLRVVGPEHRGAHVAAERQRPLAAGEVRLRPAAPEREDAAVARLAVHRERRAGQQIPDPEAHLEESAAVEPAVRPGRAQRTAQRQSAQVLLNAKAAAPLERVAPDEGYTRSLEMFVGLLASIATYNAAVAAANTVIDARKRSIQYGRTCTTWKTPSLVCELKRLAILTKSGYCATTRRACKVKIEL